MIEPRNDRVLIQPDQPTIRGAGIFSKTPIVAPGIAEEWARTGTVVAVGRKVLDVKCGDRVLFPRYAGLEFKRIEDREEFLGLRLMREEDIQAKVTDAE